VWVYVLGFFTFLLAVSSGFSLVLHPREEVDWEMWERRLRVLVRNLRTVKVEYWVSVSDSSGVSSRGLSYIKGLKRLLMVYLFQGDHLSGKPGNVREFDSCQGNVREKLPKTVYCNAYLYPYRYLVLVRA